MLYNQHFVSISYSVDAQIIAVIMNVIYSLIAFLWI